jgi:hypothetical protein
MLGTLGEDDLCGLGQIVSLFLPLQQIGVSGDWGLCLRTGVRIRWLGRSQGLVPRRRHRHQSE